MRRGPHPRLALRAALPRAPSLGVPGDPGVVVPHDVMWPIAGERLIALGGPAAVLLQVAHPLVAAGVQEHSDFRADVGHRLRNTLQGALTVTFGDTHQAHQMAARIGRRHVPVRGTLTEGARPYAAGQPYDGTDPELAVWVHATLVWTALEVNARYKAPLDEATRDAYWEQAKAFGRMFGVSDSVLPPDGPAFRAYFANTLDRLEVSPAARAIAHDVLHPRLWPPVPGLAQLTRAVTADLLPERLAAAYGLRTGGLATREAAVARAVSRAVRPLLPDRIALWPHYRSARVRLS